MIKYLVVVLAVSFCGLLVFDWAARKWPRIRACHGYLLSLCAFLLDVVLIFCWMGYRVMTCGCAP